MFFSPGIALLVFVTIYPLIFSFWISLRDWTLLFPDRDVFIGLGNYIEAFTSQTTIYTFLRSVYFGILSIAFEVVVGLAIALVLNQRFRGRGFVRALLILPWALPDVVNSVLWKWILNGDFGALNGILFQFGLIPDYIPWLSNGVLALHILIATNIWRCTPFVALILLAGLQTIPEELYEVSHLDGANFFKRLRYIIVPMLRPTILVILVIRSMDVLRIFGLIYIVTGGGPGGSTKLIGYHIFQTAFKAMRLGYASAISWILFLIVVALAIIYFRLLKEDS